MSGFRKARAEQAALKIGIYGPPGSGKTFTSLLIAEGLAQVSGKRVAMVDTEHGSDFYCKAVSGRAVHPEAFDFDALYSRSLTEVLASVKSLKESDYGVVVLDSITHLWEAAIAAYGGSQTKIGTIPMHAWGKIKRPYKDLMSVLLSSNMHVIICGRQGTEYATDEETDELKAIGVKMKAEGETPYEPHILLRMEAIKPKKTNELATIVAYAEKDRTGVLAGRSFINPTFESLAKPLLSLLGGKQAHVPTSGETAAEDAERIAQDDAGREANSAKTLKDFCARMTLATDLKALKAIGSDITPKVKAGMLTQDVALLREAYITREQELQRSPQNPDQAATPADSLPAARSDSGPIDAETGEVFPMLPTIVDVRAAINRGEFDIAADLARSLPDNTEALLEVSVAHEKAKKS